MRYMFVLCLLVLPGCSWFIPGAVKQESAMMRTNVEVAIDEIKAQPDSQSKDTALRAMYRLYPHVVNWNSYCAGRKAERQLDPRYLRPTTTTEVLTPVK